jgi:hypothetical protein
LKKLQEISNGPELTWRDASVLLRSIGFSIEFNYYDPGSQKVEIGLAPELRRLFEGPGDESFAEDFRQFIDTGRPPLKEGLTPFGDTLLEFLQERVSPLTTFQGYRGTSRWVARFKIPYKERYIPYVRRST